MSEIASRIALAAVLAGCAVEHALQLGTTGETQMKHKELKDKRVAILAADGFEHAELVLPRKAMKAAGAKVFVISLHSGRIRGMNLTEPTGTVKVDRTVEQADPEDFDALYIPGGFVGPDFLRQSLATRAFVRAFDATDKPLATMCHGPWVLASAELVAGRSLASWPGIRDDLVNAGAMWRDEAVVVDRNWVSSRGPQDFAAFVPAMIKLFANGHSAVDEGALASLSSAKPIEPPPVAMTAARHLPALSVRMLAAVATVVAAGAFAFRRAARG